MFQTCWAKPPLLRMTPHIEERPHLLGLDWPESFTGFGGCHIFDDLADGWDGCLVPIQSE